MHQATRTWKAFVAASAVSLAAAVWSGAAGVVLAAIYRPHAPGADLALLPEAHRRSDAWVDYHRLGTTVFLVGSILALVCCLINARERAGRRRWIATVASISAVCMAVAALATSSRVQWDQLALRAVTVGADIDGYWYAAFNRGVLFLIKDESEVSQAAYAPVLLTHLVAPFLGAVLLVAVWVLIRPLSASREDEAKAAPSSADEGS